MRLKDPDARLGPELSRRSLAATFFGGFALAAVSADAEPVKTSVDGLLTRTVEIPLSDPLKSGQLKSGQLKLPAFVAEPATPGKHPVVIVISEVFGIHEYIRDMCRRLAHQGYLAIAPAFFFRAGDPAGLTDFAEIRKIVATARLDQVLDDIEATLKWIRKEKTANPRKIATTGFCWGGNVVWMATSRFAQIDAGVAWYGRLAVPADVSADPDRAHPVQIATKLRSPVLGLYAGNDQGIPLADVEAMRASLKAAGRSDEIIVYPDAQHGFHADYRASFNPVAAADGWARMLAHFRAQGVG